MSRLLQGTPSPVFDTVAALMANYAAVNRRLLGNHRPTAPVVIPVRPIDSVAVATPACDLVTPAPDEKPDDASASAPPLVLDEDGHVIHRRDALGGSAPVGHFRTRLPRGVDRIIGTVAAMHGQTMDDVLGRSRISGAVMARMDAIAAVRVCYPDLSSARIGRFFNRDHATVINALARRGLTTTARVAAR